MCVCVSAYEDKDLKVRFYRELTHLCHCLFGLVQISLNYLNINKLCTLNHLRLNFVISSSIRISTIIFPTISETSTRRELEIVDQSGTTVSKINPPDLVA